MTRQEILARFPNASESFIQQNLEAHRISPGPKPEQIVCHDSVGQAQGEEGNSTRRTIRVTSFRKRLLDPDNLCPKYFIDSLRYAGCLHDDSPEFITLTVQQRKDKNERTEIEIE